MVSVHDNEIISYSVDLRNNYIVFHTQHERQVLIDIVFSDVLIHSFEDELSRSIILDICKCNIDSFIKDNKSLLETCKNNCHPIRYTTLAELDEKLTTEQYHYYAISASYGLNGWVLAKNHEIIDVTI